jgi:arsenate reductase-like glutaredoxin family protein
MVTGGSGHRFGRYAARMPSTTPTSPNVQIFGLDGDQATRAAVRFFKERRVTIHQVDLKRKPIAPGELQRFIGRLGAAALVDTEGRPYRDAGLAYLRMDDVEIVERLLADPRLLRLPLVRFGNEVTAGKAESVWKSWIGGTARSVESPR